MRFMGIRHIEIEGFWCIARSHHLRHLHMLIRKCRTLGAKKFSRQIKASHSVLCCNIFVLKTIQTLPEEWSQLTGFDARCPVVLVGDTPILGWYPLSGAYLGVPKRRVRLYRLTTKDHEMLKWRPCRAVPAKSKPEPVQH